MRSRPLKSGAALATQRMARLAASHESGDALRAVATSQAPLRHLALHLTAPIAQQHPGGREKILQVIDGKLLLAELFMA